MDANHIIDSLGGTAAVARLCHVKQPSVSGWRKHGIPRARLQFLAVIRPDVFVRSAQNATSKNELDTAA